MLKKREILKKKKRSPGFQCRGHRFGKAQKKKKKKRIVNTLDTLGVGGSGTEEWGTQRKKWQWLSSIS